jgi:phytoene desaturase
MADKKKVVIIGAGVGGIATAAFLARSGYSVDVFEKNSTPGGRCSNIVRDGHRFDLGATMLLMPGIYKSVFSSLGLDAEKSLQLKPLDELYRIYFDDNETLSFTKDREEMKAQLEKIEPGSSKKAEKYVSVGYSIFHRSLKKLIDVNFYNVFQFLNPMIVPVLFKVKAFTPHFRYTKRFFRHPHLLMAYTFQNIYVGQSPFNSPALFSMVPAAELTEGSFSPSQGGMFSVVEKLAETAESSGARFHYRKPVREIIPEAKRVTAVILDDGTRVEADIVVCNADLPYVYKELLPDSRKSRHISRLNYSCSAICIHWGLDKQYPQLGQHSVFLSDGFKNGLTKIFRDKSVSTNPSFYVHAPTRTDPSAAPPDCDTLSFIVATGHVDKNFKQDWDELKLRVREAILNRLKQMGIDDIDKHIKFEIAYSPAEWQKAVNVSRGSVFGSLGHNIFQMGYFRPHNRHDKYKNLYFAGGSTHPGNGIPNVLLSAKLTSKRILRDNNSPVTLN